MKTTTLHRAVTGSVTKFLSTVGERQIRVIASDATPDRMGDILEPGGCQLDEFRRNPIMLAQHSPDQPIGIWPIHPDKKWPPRGTRRVRSRGRQRAGG
jgi:hypothetical protein